jgi:hypothetical protein
MLELLSQMFRKKLTLSAPYSVDECVARLQPHIGTALRTVDDQRFLGKLTESRLKLRKRVSYQNFAQTVLVADLRPGPDENQATLSGHIGVSLATLCFVFVWLAVGSFVLAMFVLTPVAGHQESVAAATTTTTARSDERSIVAPLALVAANLALVLFGRWLARNEEAQLLAFLKDTIRAVPSD